MAVPPATIRVPSQKPLAPSVASVTSVTNDKGDNEIILGLCTDLLTFALQPRKMLDITGKSTGKLPLGRPRPRWEFNNRMDQKEMDINTINWADLYQNRNYWRAVLKFRVP